MTYLCYPQLTSRRARELASRLSDMTAEDARAVSATSDPATIYSPLGGARAPEGALAAFQDNCREIADQLGFPDIPSLYLRRKIDVEVTKAIAAHLKMTDYEASQSGVWDFMTCILLPDLVIWRFRATGETTTSVERFASGRRNMFERLWRRWQFIAFEDGGVNPALLERLDEDELVQVTERPRLLGSRRLQRVALQLAVDSDGRRKFGRAYIRDLQKRLLRLSSVASVEALSDDLIEQLVRKLLADCDRALTTVMNTNR